jgi:hypothetical protein
MVLLRSLVEKVSSSALADGDAGPVGRVDDVTRQDYFPSSALQDSGRFKRVHPIWTLRAHRAPVAGQPPWRAARWAPRLRAVTAAPPIEVLAVVSTTGGVVLAVLLAGVVVVTAAVLWVVMRLMADDPDDEQPAAQGRG